MSFASRRRFSSFNAMQQAVGRAHSRGRVAAASMYASASDNPYPEGSRAFHEWNRGFFADVAADDMYDAQRDRG